MRVDGQKSRSKEFQTGTRERLKGRIRNRLSPKEIIVLRTKRSSRSASKTPFLIIPPPWSACAFSTDGRLQPTDNLISSVILTPRGGTKSGFLALVFPDQGCCREKTGTGDQDHRLDALTNTFSKGGMNHLILDYELPVRLIAFSAILAGMALWEGLSPRRPRAASRWTRWINNSA